MMIKRKPAFIAATLLTLAACSGRNSTAKSVDAGSPATIDAGIDIGVDAKPIDFFAYLPTSDAGTALACMTCFKSQCGNEMNGCANNVNCREGLLCAFGQCSAWTGALSGSMSSGISSADVTCISTCFKGDLSAALLAGKSASCATTTCQKACESVLRGDGGAEAVQAADGPVPSGVDASSPPNPSPIDAPSYDGNRGAIDAPHSPTIDGAVDTGF